ncbi:MAG: TSUP family transporter [Planctomycetes bacterium]|nr:TSUP family transporter [Planctomycetota bacterium]
MSPEQLAWLAGVVFLAAAVQAALGFGASLVVMSLGALLVPMSDLLPLLVPLACLGPAAILTFDRAHVSWRLLLGRLLPLLAPGLALGLIVAERLGDAAARRAYGVLVVALAGRGLWALLRAAPADAPAYATDDAPDAAPAAPPRGTPAWLLAAGLVHGVYATGGPLLVYVVDRLRLPPRAFRATLAGVWLTLNLLLVAGFAARGRLEAASVATSAALAPCLALGLLAGHRVHTRLDPRRLRLGVLALLVVVGGTLVASEGPG